MRSSPVDEPLGLGWLEACTTVERVQVLRLVEGWSPPVLSPEDGGDLVLARWRSEAPFEGTDLLSRKLECYGVAENEFAWALSRPLGELFRQRGLALPSWQGTILRALSAPAERKIAWPTLLELGAVAEGFVQQGLADLNESLARIASTYREVPFEPQRVAALALRNLLPEIYRLTHRCMVLELNVSRLRGSLSGPSPEIRYQDFVNTIRRPKEAGRILRRYPVLARLLAQTVASWQANTLELLENLCVDWDEISGVFALRAQDIGNLEAIVSGVGDRHRGGRTVTLLRFASGYTIVYKPRSVAIEVHFSELLAWANESGQTSPFRTVVALDRGSHGWVEYVSPDVCESPSEARAFFEQQGRYLALLYALNATDFHCENLVAAGEHPVLLDLEGLFHPDLWPDLDRTAEGRATAQIRESVVSTGLLPIRTWLNEAGTGVDRSGLSSQAGQKTPFPVPQIEDPITDEMRIVHKTAVYRDVGNLPVLAGEPVPALSFRRAIEDGFVEFYRSLVERRGELVGSDGLLGRFAKDEIRVILRSTASYSRLLEESLHPDVMGDAVEREKLLDHLWWAALDRPQMAPAVAAEIQDLESCDIPIFMVQAESVDVFTSRGVKMENFLAQSGLESSRLRLEQMGERDLERQRWFLQASLATLTGGDRVKAILPGGDVSESESPAREQLMDAAVAVGDHLEETAVLGDADATWIGLGLKGRDTWLVEPLGPDLYDGLSGVIVFLAYLGAVTDEARYSKLARAGLRTLLAQVRSGLSSLIGGYCGRGGVVYALTHLGVLWGRQHLLDEAERLSAGFPELIEGDRLLDIVGGSAGCAVALRGLYRVTASEALLETAKTCGDHLLKSSTAMDRGIAWRTIPGSPPLAGFSHGSAGIAWALAELAEWTDESEFKEASLEALEYERSIFDDRQGNWPDLRPLAADEKASPAGAAWCHGAPGIGLGRMLMLDRANNQAAVAEIIVAAETTRRIGFSGNHCLCHGDLGNAEFLSRAGVRLGYPEWVAHAEGAAVQVAKAASARAWRCATPLEVPSPELMTGLAGIGYGLLRFAAPEQVPSVLALAPPPGAMRA